MNLLPKVDIQMMYAGYEPKLLLAAKEYGAEAVVLAGFGNGTMSKETLAVQRSLAAAGMIFVAASRTGNGVVSKIYPDMILAGNLTPQKARVLCMLALTQTKQPAELQEIFAQY